MKRFVRIRGNRPVVCLIDDDATRRFITDLLPILNSYNYTCSLAIITKAADGIRYSDNRLSWFEIYDLARSGFGILSHSISHDKNVWSKGHNTAMVREIADSKCEFKSHSFDVSTFVYPFSVHPKLVCLRMNKYYQYGIYSKFTLLKPGIYESSLLPRAFINWEKHGIEEYFNLIDECALRNGLLILGIHAGHYREWMDKKFFQLLDYIEKSDLIWMNFDEAVTYKRCGNILVSSQIHV